MKLLKVYNHNKWEFDFLIDHIVDIHHTYVEKSSPLILQYSNRVEDVLNIIMQGVIKIISSLQKLLINTCSSYEKRRIKILLPHFEIVKNPIKMIEKGHKTARDIFKESAILTTKYNPPKETCNTFKVL